MDGTLKIRPARESDRATVREFANEVWEEEDYINYMWDDWIADPSGPLLVGTLDDDAPIAIVKLSDLSEREGWLHGLRVAKRVHGQGIGRALTQHVVELSRQRGDRTLRLMTNEENHPMQRVSGLLGFEVRSKCSWLSSMTQPGEWEPRPLPITALPRLRADLDAALPPESGGLYCVGWRFRELTEARLLEHLANDEVLALPSQRAWAVVVPHLDDRVWVCAGTGPHEELVALAGALRAYPVDEQIELAGLLPRTTPLARALLDAGFTIPTGEWCYELRLDGSHAE